MSEGALGLSTGLFYAGGAFATTEEVIELARVAKAMGGIYESHIRAESSRGVGVHAAVDEVIEIAEASGVHAHIAHIKVLGKDVWGEAGSIVTRRGEGAWSRYYGGSISLGRVLHSAEKRGDQ